MIDIKADEDAIVKRIKDKVGRCQVGPFPDIPPLSYDLKDSHSEILVCFAGANSIESPEITMGTQTRTYRWTVNLYTKNRRSHQGAYQLLRNIDDALVGFQLRYHYMRYVDTSFVAYNTHSGIWVYKSTYEVIDQSIKGE